MKNMRGEFHYDVYGLCMSVDVYTSMSDMASSSIMRENTIEGGMHKLGLGSEEYII